MASNDTAIAAVMEQLIAEGPQGMAQVMTVLMNLAMRTEREQYLGAGHYERNSGRRGYANGTKPKKIDTPLGTLTLDGIPESIVQSATDRGVWISTRDLQKIPVAGPEPLRSLLDIAWSYRSSCR